MTRNKNCKARIGCEKLAYVVNGVDHDHIKLVSPLTTKNRFHPLRIFDGEDEIY